MATIRCTRSGNWEAQILRRGYPALSKSFGQKGEALAWAGGLESAITRGRFVDSREAEQTTLPEALNRYAAAVTPRKRGHSNKAR